MLSYHWEKHYLWFFSWSRQACAQNCYFLDLSYRLFPVFLLPSAIPAHWWSTRNHKMSEGMHWWYFSLCEVRGFQMICSKSQIIFHREGRNKWSIFQVSAFHRGRKSQWFEKLSSDCNKFAEVITWRRPILLWSGLLRRYRKEKLWRLPWWEAGAVWYHIEKNIGSKVHGHDFPP